MSWGGTSKATWFIDPTALSRPGVPGNPLGAAMPGAGPGTQDVAQPAGEQV